MLIEAIGFLLIFAVIWLGSGFVAYLWVKKLGWEVTAWSVTKEGIVSLIFVMSNPPIYMVKAKPKKHPTKQH